MEKILIFKDGKVQMAREELEKIPEFAPLFALNYNKQKGDLEGRKRERADAEITYLWFRHSFFSPYVEYGPTEAHEESLRAAYLPTNYEKSTEMLIAERWYEKYINNSRILRLLRSGHKAVDNLQIYLDTIDFTATTENGALVNKPSEVIKTIKELGQVVDGLDDLENRVKREKQQFASTRGAQESGWLMEKEKFKNKKQNDRAGSAEED